MSPVSETTVVMVRNWSSLLVMDEPPSGQLPATGRVPFFRDCRALARHTQAGT
jgi:hypothetical protein